MRRNAGQTNKQHRVQTIVDISIYLFIYSLLNVIEREERRDIRAQWIIHEGAPGCGHRGEGKRGHSQLNNCNNVCVCVCGHNERIFLIPGQDFDMGWGRYLTTNWVGSRQQQIKKTGLIRPKWGNSLEIWVSLKYCRWKCVYSLDTEILIDGHER